MNENAKNGHLSFKYPGKVSIKSLTVINGAVQYIGVYVNVIFISLFVKIMVSIMHNQRQIQKERNKLLSINEHIKNRIELIGTVLTYGTRCHMSHCRK